MCRLHTYFECCRDRFGVRDEHNNITGNNADIVWKLEGELMNYWSSLLHKSSFDLTKFPHRKISF